MLAIFVRGLAAFVTWFACLLRAVATELPQGTSAIPFLQQASNLQLEEQPSPFVVIAVVTLLVRFEDAIAAQSRGIIPARRGFERSFQSPGLRALVELVRGRRGTFHAAAQAHE